MIVINQGGFGVTLTFDNGEKVTIWTNEADQSILVIHGTTEKWFKQADPLTSYLEEIADATHNRDR